MAVVASFVGGWGHAEPLLPVARLAVSRGHEVSFAGQSAVVPKLAELGFATHVVGPDTLASARGPMAPADRDTERAVITEHFIARFGRRADVLRPLFERERPQVVVCDEVDVGAVIAAELLGVPCVTVNVIAAGRLFSPRVVGVAWNELRASYGLEADVDGCRLGGTVALTPVPRSFRDPAEPVWPSRQFVRPAIIDEVGEVVSQPGRLVYVTLGTVFNLESGDLLDRLVDAASLMDADVVVTTGTHVSPGELPAAADHVRIEQFVPQRRVLRGCGAVVSHGGSGTLIAALALGIPVVALPMGADQLDNADRCTELGVGVVLDPHTADAPAIANATSTVLDDHAYAEHARRLAIEARTQPSLTRLGELTELLRR